MDISFAKKLNKTKVTLFEFLLSISLMLQFLKTMWHNFFNVYISDAYTKPQLPFKL